MQSGYGSYAATSRRSARDYSRSRRSFKYTGRYVNAPVPYRKRRLVSAGRTSVEHKYLDTDFGGLVVGTGGIRQDTINLVPRGDAASERIGHKIVIQSVSWRYTLTTNSENSDGASVRMLLILDRQCNGSTVNFTDVFDDTEPGAVRALTYRRMENESRFVVLYDKIHDINPTTTDQTLDHHVEDSFYSKKNLGIVINWNNSITGDLAQMQSGNLVAFAVPTALDFMLVSTFRIRYVD